MMIFLYVLLVVLLLFIFILSLKINFSLCFDGNVKFSIRILFIKFDFPIPVFYRQKQYDEETEYVYREKKQTAKKKKTEKQKENLPFPGIKNTVVFFKDAAIQIFGKAVRSFRLEKLHFKAVAASPDAAKTAELYGAICIAGSSLHQFASNAKGIKKNAVYVEVIPDFLAETADFYADLRFSTRIWRVLSLAISGVSVWQNYKKLARSVMKEKENANTSNSEKETQTKN